ncbi:helix-turn-helix domain-containing protein [Cryobacterium lactosi]|uniref:Helix-turn-helix domain-containing protein n=1 Tax=Cryobacterium lactosi TaxID=1259202 RepID=A0A4R9BVD1_9MICO|nr:helix-turn-helix domain-containing protein [Cryobacterium lactosi]TFD91692.1 helix-turn-helix domain-containing protein [Cryobacterium lactosi]
MSADVHTAPPSSSPRPRRIAARAPSGTRAAIQVTDESVETQDAALWVYRGVAAPMTRPHRHDDLELNFVLRGRLDYLFGGTRLSVEAGEVAMFWGATAHLLVEPEGGHRSDSCWVHIPLTTVFGWRLPAGDLNDLLSNRPIIVPVRAAARDIEEMFASWADDAGRESTETVTLLEAHALVRRLMTSHRAAPTVANERLPPSAAVCAPHSMDRVMQMARYIAAHFRDPVGPADVTDAAHLNSNYAMSLFRNTIGTTVGDYLTRCRVAEARRLLITTTMGASGIAHASGFGSQSSFYAHFSRMCGVSPAEYRSLHR